MTLKRRAGFLLLWIFCSLLNLKANDPDLMIPEEGQLMDHVLLRGLDKITARVSDIEIPLGQTSQLGTLEIIPRFCQNSLPEDAPEAKAYLEIYEQQNEGKKLVFSGWMFASSPAISALEHPVYDVWVKTCTGKPIQAQDLPSSASMNSVKEPPSSSDLKEKISPVLDSLRQGLESDKKN